MIYTAEKNQWIADSATTNISDAKLVTPMAANAQIQSDGSQQVLFYGVKDLWMSSNLTPHLRSSFTISLP